MPDEGKNWEIFGHVCMFANGGTSCVPALLAVDGFFFMIITKPRFQLASFSKVARSGYFSEFGEVTRGKLPTTMVWRNNSM